MWPTNANSEGRRFGAINSHQKYSDSHCALRSVYGCYATTPNEDGRLREAWRWRYFTRWNNTLCLKKEKKKFGKVFAITVIVLKSKQTMNRYVLGNREHGWHLISVFLLTINVSLLSTKAISIILRFHAKLIIIKLRILVLKLIWWIIQVFYM